MQTKTNQHTNQRRMRLRREVAESLAQARPAMTKEEAFRGFTDDEADVVNERAEAAEIEAREEAKLDAPETWVRDKDRDITAEAEESLV